MSGVNATIVFMTGRADPQLGPTLSDLCAQMIDSDDIEFLVIDALDRTLNDLLLPNEFPICPRGLLHLQIAPPKPNLWQGKNRVTTTPDPWWATANARNTAIVLATRPYLAFLDDRCRLGSDWLGEVRDAARQNQIIAGAYQKTEMRDEETIISRDHRLGLKPEGMRNCGGGWLYGCTFGVPLSFALECNGLEEGCDGLTGEDYIFGLMLGNNGHRIDYVPSLFVAQDRTRGNETCKGSYICVDKGVSPNDKSHAALARFGKRKRTEFTPDLAELRVHMAAGGEWPIPDLHFPHRDWYDGQLISEMTRP